MFPEGIQVPTTQYQDAQTLTSLFLIGRVHATNTPPPSKNKDYGRPGNRLREFHRSDFHH